MFRNTSLLLCLVLTLASNLAAQSATLTLEIGGEKPDYTFFRAIDLAVDEQGRIAVLDAGDKIVRVYSPKGVFLVKFGRAGGGPGEFNVPVDVTATRAGWEVVDPRLGRSISFSVSGAHLETRSLPAPDGLVLGRLTRLRHGFALAKTVYRASPGTADHDPSVRVLLISESSRSVTDTLAAFEVGVGVWSVPGRSAPWGIVPLPWLGAGGTAAVSGDSLVLIGGSGVITFYSISPNGLRRLESADLGLRPAPAAAARLRGVQDSIQQAQKNPSIRVVGPSTVFPLTGESFFDSAGNAWIELNTSEQAHVWKRITPGTRFATSVRLPAAFQLKAVQRNNLYGITTDELGVQTVRVYKLELNE